MFESCMRLYRGSALRAWRLDYDPGEVGEVVLTDFARISDGFGLEVVSASRAAGPDATSNNDLMVRFSDVAPEESANLWSFLRVVELHLGIIDKDNSSAWPSRRDMGRVWRHLARDGQPLLRPHSFSRSVKAMGFIGDENLLFQGLDLKAQGKLSRYDFEAINFARILNCPDSGSAIIQVSAKTSPSPMSSAVEELVSAPRRGLKSPKKNYPFRASDVRYGWKSSRYSQERMAWGRRSVPNRLRQVWGPSAGTSRARPGELVIDFQEDKTDDSTRDSLTNSANDPSLCFKSGSAEGHTSQSATTYHHRAFSFATDTSREDQRDNPVGACPGSSAIDDEPLGKRREMLRTSTRRHTRHKSQRAYGTMKSSSDGGSDGVVSDRRVYCMSNGECRLVDEARDSGSVKFIFQRAQSNKQRTAKELGGEQKGQQRTRRPQGSTGGTCGELDSGSSVGSLTSSRSVSPGRVGRPLGDDHEDVKLHVVMTGAAPPQQQREHLRAPAYQSTCARGHANNDGQEMDPLGSEFDFDHVSACRQPRLVDSPDVEKHIPTSEVRNNISPGIRISALLSPTGFQHTFSDAFTHCNPCCKTSGDDGSNTAFAAASLDNVLEAHHEISDLSRLVGAAPADRRVKASGATDSIVVQKKAATSQQEFTTDSKSGKDENAADMFESTGTTVWDVTEEHPVELDSKEVQFLFSQDMSPRASTLDPIAPRFALHAQRLQVLDQKRRQQMCRMLARLPETKRICNIVRRMATTELSIDQVQLLLLNLPTQDEIDTLLAVAKVTFRSNSEDGAVTLDVAEEYVLATSEVPCFALRLHIWAFEAAICDQLPRLRDAVRLFDKGFGILMNSGPILRLLALILHTGNSLNAGTAWSSAQGFTIDTLAQMRKVKMAKACGSGTLIDYLALKASQHFPGELDSIFMLGREVDCIKAAARQSFVNIREESDDIWNEVSLLLLRASHHQHQATEDDVILRRHIEILSMCSSEVADVRCRLAAVNDRYAKFSSWFRMGQNATPPDEIFAIWDVFFTDLARARERLAEDEQRTQAFREASLRKLSQVAALSKLSPRSTSRKGTTSAGTSSELTKESSAGVGDRDADVVGKKASPHHCTAVVSGGDGGQTVSDDVVRRASPCLHEVHCELLGAATASNVASSLNLDVASAHIDANEKSQSSRLRDRRRKRTTDIAARIAHSISGGLPNREDSDD